MQPEIHSGTHKPMTMTKGFAMYTFDSTSYMYEILHTLSLVQYICFTCPQNHNHLHKTATTSVEKAFAYNFICLVITVYGWLLFLTFIGPCWKQQRHLLVVLPILLGTHKYPWKLQSYLHMTESSTEVG